MKHVDNPPSDALLVLKETTQLHLELAHFA